MRPMILSLLVGLVACGAPAAVHQTPLVKVAITRAFEVTGPSEPREGYSAELAGAPVLIFDVAPADLPNMVILVHYTDPDSGQPAVKHIYPGHLASFTGTDGKDAPTSITASLSLENERPFLRRVIIAWPNGRQGETNFD